MKAVTVNDAKAAIFDQMCHYLTPLMLLTNSKEDYTLHNSALPGARWSRVCVQVCVSVFTKLIVKKSSKIKDVLIFGYNKYKRDTGYAILLERQVCCKTHWSKCMDVNVRLTFWSRGLQTSTAYWWPPVQGENHIEESKSECVQVPV